MSEWGEHVEIDENGRRVITPVWKGQPKSGLPKGDDPLPPSVLRMIAWLWRDADDE